MTRNKTGENIPILCYRDLNYQKKHNHRVILRHRSIVFEGIALSSAVTRKGCGKGRDKMRRSRGELEPPDG